jgi:Protein of unknown function (DUF1566)
MKSKRSALLLISSLACGAALAQIPAPLMKGLEGLIKKNEPDQRSASPNVPAAAPAANSPAQPKAAEASSNNVAMAKQESAAAANRYVISDDKTETTDNQTGLTWTRNRQRIFMGLLYDGQKNMSTQAPYNKALEHAKLVSQKDGMVWRLPTVEEIGTLRIRTAEEAAAKSASSFDRTLYDVNAFPNILEAGGVRFWTADTVPPNRSPVTKAQAVTFSLDMGGALSYAKTMDANDLLRVILVRGILKK